MKPSLSLSYLCIFMNALNLEKQKNNNIMHQVSLHSLHRCGPSSVPGLGRGRICVKSVISYLPYRSVVSSTRKLISSSSFHRLDMTLAVAEALNPNTPTKPLFAIIFFCIFCKTGRRTKITEINIPTHKDIALERLTAPWI